MKTSGQIILILLLAPVALTCIAAGVLWRSITACFSVGIAFTESYIEQSAQAERERAKAKTVK